MKRPLSLPPIGSVHHYLTVIAHAGRINGHQRLLCRCQCGVEVVVRADTVLNGSTGSCGCYRREWASKTHRKHGESGGAPGGRRSLLYRLWKSIRDRIVRGEAYVRREITLCPEWTEHFEPFRDYVDANLGPRPSDQHSIDRIDNDRGYEPGNLRWALRVTQARNRSSNRVITIDGESRCIAEWAEIAGIPPTLIYDRLRRGWSERLAVALSKQPRGRKPKAPAP